MISRSLFKQREFKTIVGLVSFLADMDSTTARTDVFNRLRDLIVRMGAHCVWVTEKVARLPTATEDHVGRKVELVDGKASGMAGCRCVGWPIGGAPTRVKLPSVGKCLRHYLL